jgi:hypothetical protein
VVVWKLAGKRAKKRKGIKVQLMVVGRGNRLTQVKNYIKGSLLRRTLHDQSLNQLPVFWAGLIQQYDQGKIVA